MKSTVINVTCSITHATRNLLWRISTLTVNVSVILLHLTKRLTIKSTLYLRLFVSLIADFIQSMTKPNAHIKHQ